MYEAPDRYKRMISARLPGGESLGLTSEQVDDASSPLKDVQLISRAQLAPFFAAANIVAALMMIAALWDEVDPVLSAAVGSARSAVANLLAMQVARTQSITHVGRSGQQVPRLAAGRRSRRPRAASGSRCRSTSSRRFRPGRRSSPPRSPRGSASPRLGLVVVPRSRDRPGCRRSPPASTGALFLGRNTRALPAHAVDPVHARRVDLRRPQRRPLGVRPAQDQRRLQRAERKREPAAPGI